MTMFVVANLGDAVVTIPAGSVNSGGTLSSGGFVWVNNTTSSPITITLAAALTPFALLKDVAGNAGAFPITVSFAGGIDGVTSVQLTYPYAWVWLGWNGNDYSIVGNG